MGTHGGNGAGEDDGIHCRAGCRQSIRTEGRNRVRGGGAHVRRHCQAGIIAHIGRNSDLFLVVVQAVTAAEHESVAESMRTPGKTDLGSEVILLRVPGVSLLKGQASQVIRPRARMGHKHVALFGGEWAKVGPAQAEIDGQVRPDFEIVLDKEAPDVCALVLANRRGEPRRRGEVRTFVMRRPVAEVPDVEEVVPGHAATGTVLQVKEAREFTAKLNGVVSDNLGGHILVAVSPLIQDAADIRSKRIWRTDAADAINVVGGKSNRRLRVGSDLIPVPSGAIEASFVEEGRRERVVPDSGKRLIDLLVMEVVVGTGPAVKEIG